MAYDPLTAVAGVISQVIDRVWPDPAIAAQAKAELAKMQVNGELQNISDQIAVNKVEASNASIFVAGWRPFIGWVCGIALGYDFIAVPILSWASSNFGWLSPPALDIGTLLTVLGGMLGLGGLRSIEKVNGVASNSIAGR